MFPTCFWSFERKNHIKAESNGFRATFFYPNGGTYQGCFKNSREHTYGVLTNKNGLIYDGGFWMGKRHGYGTMRQKLPNGQSKRIYIGGWEDGKKSGEGKQFYDNGIYYGWWRYGGREGLGIKWYNDGTIYLGEWKSDVKHGLGVLFHVNGNRYEGNFARGYKNGEGTFYHMSTGQIQKGMWENDICKASMIVDEFRNQVIHPTPYPIPPLRLRNPDSFICKLFRKYIDNAKKPPLSANEMYSLQMVKKIRDLAKLQPSSVFDSQIPFEDIDFPVTCHRTENVLSAI